MLREKKKAKSEVKAKEMFNMERAKVGTIKLIFCFSTSCLVSGVDITSVNNELSCVCCAG